MSLSRLHPGDDARLIEVGGTGAFRRRLLEMGLLPGTVVHLVRRVDVGGLVELEVRGSRLTVRRSEADALRVEPL